MNKALGVLAISTALITGCATVETQPPRYEVGIFPETDTSTTVYVGQVMVSKYDYLSQLRAVLMNEVDGSFMAGRDRTPAGASLVSVIAAGQQRFCRPSRNVSTGCYEDTDGDMYFDRAYTMNAFNAMVSGRNIDPVRYRIEDQNIEDGFKYELIYQGLSSGVVRIAYREYTDNLARPAFSQDLTYTLEQPLTDIRFRDVEVTIHHADNNEITYVVQSGF